MSKKQYNCAIEATVELVSGKWKLLILHYLMQDTKRFGELRRLIPQVTQQMLTQHLRELEEDGIVDRKVYPQVPPKVEYSLTATGRSLEPVLQVMFNWGEVYLKQIKQAELGKEQCVASNA